VHDDRGACLRLCEHMRAHTLTTQTDRYSAWSLPRKTRRPVTRGMIGEFLIRPDVRVRSVGSALFAHAMEYLRAYGCTNIALSAASSRVAVRLTASVHSNVEEISWSMWLRMHSRPCCTHADIHQHRHVEIHARFWRVICWHKVGGGKTATLVTVRPWGHNHATCLDNECIAAASRSRIGWSNQQWSHWAQCECAHVHGLTVKCRLWSHLFTSGSKS
jgi:hypothetical protein